MSDEATPELNDCGCCEGVKDKTPVDIFNLPGLTTLAYRVGTHSRFKESMQVDLTRHPPLLDLKTRRNDDPTIGLLDAWATVLDVLTFYQERIANEGYLRTGTERRSLLELARSIGYELRPGVAASTYLMFTMETAAGAPREAVISVGTKAQSVPEQDQQAQTFETIEEITGRPAWNELLPRLTQPQRLRIHGAKLEYRTGTEVRVLYFQGTSTGLAPGDRILITRGSAANTRVLSKRVLRVKTDDEAKQTKVEIETTTANPDGLPLAQPTAFFDTVPFPPNAPLLPFNDENITKVLALHLRERDLQTFLEVNLWNANDLAEYVQKRAATRAVPRQASFAFRERVGFFGNNAPPWASLRDKDNHALFPVDWDSPGWTIWGDYPSLKSIDPRLEHGIPGIVKDSWVMFSNATAQRIYRVKKARESSVVGFAISGKTTSLELADPNTAGPTRVIEFLVRNTTAYVKSEPLALAAVPVSDVIGAGTAALELEEMVLGLKRGQLIVLT